VFLLILISGEAGTIVNIIGRNLNPRTVSNKVFFDAIRDEVLTPPPGLPYKGVDNIFYTFCKQMHYQKARDYVLSLLQQRLAPEPVITIGCTTPWTFARLPEKSQTSKE
jgi:hypothetical protein